jgi:hypothetical protein
VAYRTCFAQGAHVLLLLLLLLTDCYGLLLLLRVCRWLCWTYACLRWQWPSQNGWAGS